MFFVLIFCFCFLYIWFLEKAKFLASFGRVPWVITRVGSRLGQTICRLNLEVWLRLYRISLPCCLLVTSFAFASRFWQDRRGIHRNRDLVPHHPYESQNCRFRHYVGCSAQAFYGRCC